MTTLDELVKNPELVAELPRAALVELRLGWTVLRRHLCFAQPFTERLDLASLTARAI
jgi:hypothetical protein